MANLKQNSCKFNKIFSDRQLCQGVKFQQSFRDWLRPWNVEEFSHLDATVCLRSFYWILSPQKLQSRLTTVNKRTNRLCHIWIVVWVKVSPRNMSLKGESLVLDGDAWSAPRPGHFIPEKDPYSLYRRLGSPQGRSEGVRKTHLHRVSNPRTVQTASSRYTVYAVPVPCISYITNHNDILHPCTINDLRNVNNS